MTRVLSVLVALALVALPSAASAQATTAPPGNSAIDEYLETVPSATGNQRPGTPGTGGKNDSVLTKAERTKLEQLGPDGKALADAIDATAPPAAKPGQKLDESAGAGRSPIGAVLEAVTGTGSGGGMGIFLPLILLASLLGVIALALRRRSAS